METLIVIPARYDSTRLPGKALADIAGKPMIIRTWERVCAQVDDCRIVVATDDQRIGDACDKEGAEWVMTGECRTGTDRVAAAAHHYPNSKMIINVQGDEPLLPLDVISRIRNSLQTDVAATCGMAACPAAMMSNPTCIKVVCDNDNRPMYLSRSPIPHGAKQSLMQVCVYAFWPHTLNTYVKLSTHTAEQAEHIELLRFLEHGMAVHMVMVPTAGVPVDVPADLEKVRKLYAEVGQ